MTLYDWSGRRQNGTLTNFTLSSAWVGGELVFDGSNDYVIIPTIPTATIIAGMSVSLWIRPGSTSAGLKLALANVDPNRIYIGNDGATLYTRCADGSNMSSSTVATNTWYHVAMTWTATTAKAYLNGAQIGSATGLTWSASPAGIGTAIGAYYRTDTTNSSWFPGSADDVRLYDRSLWQTEIATLALRRGAAYELDERRFGGQQAAAFQSYWARQRSYVIGGGVQ
jgi:hypothetical protein